MATMIKDDTYNFDDGNRDFRVGDCLFRLHGSILRMHSTFFRNMFELPQGMSQNTEPMTCDDSPDAFRALCWALYADPLDTGNEREISSTNVRKLSHIGLLAHKYEFPKIEQWIINICAKLPPAETLKSFPLSDLQYFAHVISQCGWSQVKEQLDDRIVHGVAQEKNFSAIATASTLSNAISVADHIGDEVLRAHVYYYYLASAGWDLHHPPNNNESPSGKQKQKSALKIDTISRRSTTLPLTNLTPTQKLCLFRGYASFQTLRNRLRYFPVSEPFPPNASCDTPVAQWRSCYGIWHSWWVSQLERIEGLVVMDGPLEFLSAMIKKVVKDPPHLSGHNLSGGSGNGVGNGNGNGKPECMGYVLAQLTELEQAFVNDLPNYFVPCVLDGMDQEQQVRDEEFYLKMGLLHRSIIRRTLNVFNKWLPPSRRVQDPDGTGGKTVDHPMICFDTAPAFRAWCSAIYASEMIVVGVDDVAGPSQVKDEEYYFEDGNCVFWVEGVLFNGVPPCQRFNKPTVEDLDNEKVAHIGLMAHKYECDAMESWAKDTLLARLVDADDDLTNECLEYWLKVATQCFWPQSIVTAVESRLLNNISESSPQNLRVVIRIADNVESEVLKARAYYHFLHVHRWSLSPSQRGDRDLGGSSFKLGDVTSMPWSESLVFLTDT
ncbi:hypothetical protein NP233_g1166 [Leucocoprinus birnbaumii]|uniref:BTB domain-containing protein n=1 Tax=Leucocoprinus birnbaumii TaxID=56174 RepID=A0AAD5W3F1_9AGAR|nr:hypothetical protein NP233_g1166 [Leucocoprinus birnbaumii]